MMRNIVLRLCNFMPDQNIRILMGACGEFYSWKSHSYFVEFRIDYKKLVEKLISNRKRSSEKNVYGAEDFQLIRRFLKPGNPPKLQFEACWTVTNIASGTHEQTLDVIKSGVIPLIVDLVSSPDPDVYEQAIWALGNVAGDSLETREVIMQCGFFEKCLLYLSRLEERAISLIRNCAWTISNLCRVTQWDSRLMPVIPYLAQMIRAEDTGIVSDVCWSLSYITAFPQNITPVMETQVHKRLAVLLGHASSSVQVPVLRLVGNMIAGTDMETAEMVHAGVLPPLRAILSRPRVRGFCPEVCWVISNITSSTVDMVQVVLQSGVVEDMLKILSTSVDLDAVKEILFTLRNIVDFEASFQIEYLVQMGILEVLLIFLEKPNDAVLIVIVLHIIEKILWVGKSSLEKVGKITIYERKVEAYGGIELIDSLQRHQSVNVFRQARDIIRKYFSTNDDNDDNGEDGGKDGVTVISINVNTNNSKPGSNAQPDTDN